MPMYSMFLFSVPRGMAKIMKMTMRDFMWDEVDGDLHFHMVA